MKFAKNKFTKVKFSKSLQLFLLLFFMVTPQIFSQSLSQGFSQDISQAPSLNPDNITPSSSNITPLSTINNSNLSEVREAPAYAGQQFTVDGLVSMEEQLYLKTFVKAITKEDNQELITKIVYNSVVTCATKGYKHVLSFMLRNGLKFPPKTISEIYYIATESKQVEILRFMIERKLIPDQHIINEIFLHILFEDCVMDLITCLFDGNLIPDILTFIEGYKQMFIAGNKEMQDFLSDYVPSQLSEGLLILPQEPKIEPLSLPNLQSSYSSCRSSNPSTISESSQSCQSGALDLRSEEALRKAFSL